METASAITLEEPSVAACVSRLEAHGFNMEILNACLETDIDALAPTILRPIEALKLKIALRRHKSQQYDEDLYGKLLGCVGLLQVFFTDQSVQEGNVVLVGERGLAVTAQHVLVPEEDEADDLTIERKVKASRKGKGGAPSSIEGKEKVESFSKKGRPQRMINAPSERNKTIECIQVTFPNTGEGFLQYKALILHTSSIEDDLALLQAIDALPSRFLTTYMIRSWPRYEACIGERVLLLSFPAGKGEQTRISHNPSGRADLPWRANGIVSCVDTVKGQAFADYTSFGGASGALVVHPLLNEGSYRAFLHLGTYHESEPLRSWGPSELSNLNVSLGQKGCNGYFSLKVGAFLDSYFQPSGIVPSRHLHPQVVVRKRDARRKREDEKVEEIGLFDRWPGLGYSDED